LMLVGMMVLPLPVLLLDLFFTINILMSLLILMVALQTHRPLDFSSFPSLLLLATVLRLALNVASTRIVLSEGHTGTSAAGQVIEAFGAFVIAGNFVVGCDSGDHQSCRHHKGRRARVGGICALYPRRDAGQTNGY
jgi:flagellar biosynthesis protein FlhA